MIMKFLDAIILGIKVISYITKIDEKDIEREKRKRKKKRKKE